MGGFFHDVSEGRIKEVRAWLETGQDVDKVDTYGNTALLLAAEKGHPLICQMLIDFGANLNHKNTAVGWTALHYAAYEGHAEVINLLLEFGAVPDKVDNSGDTPESWAEEWGNKGCSDILKEATERRKRRWDDRRQSQCDVKPQLKPTTEIKTAEIDQNGNKQLDSKTGLI